MGISCTLDMCQEIIEDIFSDVNDAECFIDNIGAFSNSWKEHLELLEKVLSQLQDYAFTVNPLKCRWVVKEMDWFGYWLTPVGLKLWKKNIQGILNRGRPQNKKQINLFLRGVNFCRGLWPRQSHVLTPLTTLT